MSAGRASILIVEDDWDVRELLAMVLRAHGYQVQTAQNGAEAFALVASGAEPAVILLDLMMPEMSGAELLTRLRALPRSPSAQVVVISGDFDAPERSASLGAVACLRKPVELADLLSAVEKASSAVDAGPAST